MKNILYISNEGELKGGGQLSLWNLVRRLDKNKFMPFFICPSEGSFVSILRKAGIPVDIVGFPRLKSLNLFGIVSTTLQIKHIIKEKNVDIVHSNGPRMSLVSALAAHLAQVPIIWHERTLVEKGMWDSDRFFCFLADKIICNSDAIRKRFVKKGKIHEKVITIINAVDIAIFNSSVDGFSVRREFNIQNDEIVIGMASRIEPTKGQFYFLNAVRDLAKRYSNLKFLVASDTFDERSRMYKQELNEFITMHKLENKVIFTGLRDDMPNVFAAMDIAVLAADAEACGRVLFEAMASGKPVVATNSGGTPEIVVDNETGILIPPKDSKALAAALLKLINDRDLARAMGLKGRERVEKHFTIEEHLRKTEAVYEEVLNARADNKR